MMKKILNIVFPHPSMCIFCEEKWKQLGICEACETHLATLGEREGQCRRCGSFGFRGKVCDTCREWPSYYKGNQALFPYTEEVREMIVRMKFHHEPWRLEGLMGVLEKTTYPPVDAIVPVPLHPIRLRERGYNQSLILANLIGQCTGVTVEKTWLERCVNTAHQVDLPRSQRMQNVAQAFVVPKNLKNIQSVLLVDDVLTTGATLLSCARVLHQGGVKEIYSMTIAAGIH